MHLSKEEYDWFEQRRPICCGYYFTRIISNPNPIYSSPRYFCPSCEKTYNFRAAGIIITSRLSRTDKRLIAEELY